MGDPANLPLRDPHADGARPARRTAPERRLAPLRGGGGLAGLNATRDPASARQLFQSFERTSLEEPSPPFWDYLWLEDHPTLMQRIAMAERWQER